MTAAELLASVRAAARGDEGLRLQRLHRVDGGFLDDLRGDVELICVRERPSDVSSVDHVTHWTQPSGEVSQFSLVNRTGRFDDFSSDHDHSCVGKQFRHGAQYPAVGRLATGLPHLVNFRINVLGPGARLAPHQEQLLFRTAAGGVGARLRFHLPISTFPGSAIVLDGRVHHLRCGDVYFVNHGCVHEARNDADGARVHLVWDMLFTPAVHAWMLGKPPNDLPMRGLDTEGSPEPLRVERVPPCPRLRSTVPADEADQVTLCDPQ